MSEKKQSSSKERAVEAYLRPKNHSVVIGYSKLNEISRSEVVNLAVKCFIEHLPQDIKERIFRDNNNY